jgi:hypothetical protein
MEVLGLDPLAIGDEGGVGVGVGVGVGDVRDEFSDGDGGGGGGRGYDTNINGNDENTTYLPSGADATDARTDSRSGFQPPGGPKKRAKPKPTTHTNNATDDVNATPSSGQTDAKASTKSRPKGVPASAYRPSPLERHASRTERGISKASRLIERIDERIARDEQAKQQRQQQLQ